ncbi:uncharacterized protein LOC106875686 [Octopus bimaculoides]|uniref:TIL domain-containing protein n=1 Tax=Octopus bimaculoides TaxID=37653 RepID=A0A0L8GNV8_OCTBM|nr:uncharacterized protein LOC106875686 [Octopus bimaculoides]|eukprot:XP_014779422.1 PREDICTED: uncharacterized protein LOC106875686 [Octopus bimaculoides]
MVSSTLKWMLISLVLCVAVEAVFLPNTCKSRCLAVQCRNAMRITCQKLCTCKCRTPWEVRLNKENCPEPEHGGFEHDPTFGSQHQLVNYPH